MDTVVKDFRGRFSWTLKSAPSIGQKIRIIDCGIRVDSGPAEMPDGDGGPRFQPAG